MVVLSSRRKWGEGFSKSYLDPHSHTNHITQPSFNFKLKENINLGCVPQGRRDTQREHKDAQAQEDYKYIKERVKKFREKKGRVKNYSSKDYPRTRVPVSKKKVDVVQVNTAATTVSTPSKSITTITTTPSKDKDKGIMVEEPLKMKKKDQINFDEQEAIRLQAEFDEEVRLSREKDEANVALIEEWNDIQAKINVDYQLAQRLQAQEQEELTIEERAKLFLQLLEKRRKHFATKRVEEKRNRPPTRAQQRSIMCTYLKNMVGWKPKDLKNKSFANIQELFDKAMKRVNTFVDMDIKLVEGSEKVDKDKETTKLQSLMEVILDEEEVAVDAIPLATKPPSIERFGNSVEIEVTMQRNLQGNKVLVWKLFDSCGVHFVRFQSLHVFMLVEKRYPLTPATITKMLNKKLQADHWNEMCYRLLKLITKQLKNQ
ncbi:hypothetical protein Tco_0184143 [Tanacetum coccineum]